MKQIETGIISKDMENNNEFIRKKFIDIVGNSEYTTLSKSTICKKEILSKHM